MKHWTDLMVTRIFILVGILIVVLVFTRCSTLEAPPQWEMLEQPFKEYTPTPVQPHPDDGKPMTITVGEARSALSVASQFDLLVPQYNLMMSYANEVSSERDLLLSYARRAYKKNRALEVLAGVGIGASSFSLLVLLFGGK